MERRDFLKKTSATIGTLLASGHLPMLHAAKSKPSASTPALNIFTKPAAIEPIRGTLRKFTLKRHGNMLGSFNARFSLIYWRSAGGPGQVKGDVHIQRNNDSTRTTEKRQGNTVVTNIKGHETYGDPFTWSLDSVFGASDTRFIEEGHWDGNKMMVKANSWHQESSTRYPLIHKWALLPLVASGSLKKSPLQFDLLDDSTLRPNQLLRYEGEVVTPLGGGRVSLDSYIQTGHAIQPIHYLVDDAGRVQLITSSIVNWTLLSLT